MANQTPNPYTALTIAPQTRTPNDASGTGHIGVRHTCSLPRLEFSQSRISIGRTGVYMPRCGVAPTTSMPSRWHAMITWRLSCACGKGWSGLTAADVGLRYTQPRAQCHVCSRGANLPTPVRRKNDLGTSRIDDSLKLHHFGILEPTHLRGSDVFRQLSKCQARKGETTRGGDVWWVNGGAGVVEPCYSK